MPVSGLSISLHVVIPNEERDLLFLRETSPRIKLGV